MNRKKKTKLIKRDSIFVDGWGWWGIISTKALAENVESTLGSRKGLPKRCACVCVCKCLCVCACVSVCICVRWKRAENQIPNFSLDGSLQFVSGAFQVLLPFLPNLWTEKIECILLYLQVEFLLFGQGQMGSANCSFLYLCIPCIHLHISVFHQLKQILK